MMKIYENLDLLCWVTFTIFGCIIGRQIYVRHKNHRIDVVLSTSWLLILISPICCIFFWFSRHSLVYSSLILLLIIGFELLFIIYAIYRRKQQFNKNLFLFLDDIAIKLLSGLSFRDAIVQLKIHPHFANQFDFSEIISAFEFLAGSPTLKNLLPEAQRMYWQLVQIHESNFNVLPKIQALRARLKADQVAMEKVNIASAQVKGQLMVAASLYMGLLIYIWIDYPDFILSGWFVVSLFLFGLGIYIIQLMTKKAMKVVL